MCSFYCIFLFFDSSPNFDYFAYDCGTGIEVDNILVKLSMVSKKDLSEIEICDRYFTPAIKDAGWNQSRQIRREYKFTAGRIILKGKLFLRGKKKRADYVFSINRICRVEKVDKHMALCDQLDEKLNQSKQDEERLMKAVVKDVT